MKRTCLYSILIFFVSSFSSPHKAMVGENLQGNQRNENVNIEMKVLSGDDVAKLFGPTRTRNVETSDDLYVFGMIWNSGGKRAIVQLDLFSQKIPYLRKDDIKLGWIAPNRSEPVFFLESLGTLSGGKSKLNDLNLAYRIKKVWEK